MKINVCNYCKVEFIPHKLHPHAKTCSSKQCRLDYKAEWSRNNPEGKRRYVERHPDKRAESSKAYMKRNRPYYTEYANRRRFTEQCATPPWADLPKLVELYAEASRLGLEVDHIIPLKNDKVCGLHVPDNLQFLTRTANARKSNKFDLEKEG